MTNILTSIAEELSNRLLRLDPETLERFADLDGKVVLIRLKDSSLKFYIRPFGGGFRMSHEWDKAPDVTLTGSAFAFAKLATSESDTDLFFKREILIEGDTALGRRFSHILKKLDIDWEEIASHYVGDVVAHQFGNIARDARQWTSDAAETLGK
ncbi:MAG TPA: Sterol-binding domain protein, partial [Acidiferrobacteraceae bacterium]|nr:Sterol-binding domain protein [Acidiferrobacteraceae bacterium]